MRRRLRVAVLALLALVSLTACTLFDRGPEARFDVSPVVVYAGDSVRFDASPSTGAPSIVAYAWEFGSGTSSAGQMVTTSFPEAGTVSVRLTVEDAEGRIDTVESEITVYLHSGTVLFEETFSDGPAALGHWPLDPTWATAGDASIERIAGDPGYALYVRSEEARWHRRYTGMTTPPLRVGQELVFSCRIMTLQTQDHHTFLFSPARPGLDAIAGSLPYFLFSSEAGGSYVREPSGLGSDVPRPIPFLPDVYRWHTYTFRYRPGSYDLVIDDVAIYSGSHEATFADSTDWILVLGEESLTEACVAYFDDVRISVEE